MTKFCRAVSFFFWLLGLLTLVVAVVWRFVPHRSINLGVEVRSMLLVSAVFFLGAIASRAMERTAPS